MKMSRIDRKIRVWDVTDTLANGVPASIPGVDIALLPPLAESPTAATGWTPMTYDAATGKATILLAGPEADSTGALVITATAAVWMRVTDAPEVEAISVERITVLGNGAALPALPALYVASVNGMTGAVTIAAGGGVSITDNGDGTASTTSSSVADNGDGTATAA